MKSAASKDGLLIKRTDVSNTFDSWGNLTSSTAVVTDKDTYSPLVNNYWTTTTSQTVYPNTTYWCLDLPSSVLGSALQFRVWRECSDPKQGVQ